MSPSEIGEVIVPVEHERANLDPTITPACAAPPSASSRPAHAHGRTRCSYVKRSTELRGSVPLAIE
jgi:hypothetical protein